MGFLSSLVKLGQKPFRALNMEGADLIGQAAGAYKKKPGATAVSSAPKSDPATNGGFDASNIGGDPNDPGYGSLTKPFDVEQFYNYADPGYAFELQQGTQAIQNAASAGSGAFSGAALKDLLSYSQNFARTGYNDAFNRYQVQQGNIFSRLSDLAHLGQNAAAGVGSQGTALAGNAGQMVANAGAASGAGLVGAGNAVNNGLTNYWLYATPQGRKLWGGG